MTDGMLEQALAAANRDVDERLVISALSNMALRLITREAVLEVKPDIFGSEVHAEIWEAAKILAGDSRMMTSANLRPHLSAQALRRFDELSGRPVREIEFTEGLKLIRDASRRRELIKVLQQIATETATAETAGDALASAHESLATLEGEDVSVQSVTLAEALDEFWQEVEDPKRVAERFPTPWPSLNDLTLGGHARGDLVTFMAASGGGKTILLMQEAAEFAAKGLNVAVFSLEMSRIQLTNRLLASTAGVNVSQIALRDVSGEAGEKLASATGKLESPNVHIFEAPDMTIQDMRAQCAVLKRLHGLDVVVIDYIQRVTPSQGHSRETEVGHIVSQMKKMAMALNVVVLTASQMNERSEGRPTKESARESRVIIHESNLVVALHGHNEGEVDMVVVKNRDGKEADGLLMWWKPAISSVLDPTG